MDQSILDRLAAISIEHLATGSRFQSMDRLDAYFSGVQYDGLKYDWDGNFQAYGGEADIAPGWYVPLKQRRPSVRVDLPKLIVSRFTAMLLGDERFPLISVAGDSVAEDYVRAMATAAKFELKLQEARNYGGTAGTAVVSFAFIDGKPRLSVHRAKHIHVIRWADRYELRPAEVLKCYRYERTVIEAGKLKRKPFFYARLWTETHEVIWQPISLEDSKQIDWASRVESIVVEHAYGECPVFWQQNLPDSENEDGHSDFEGLCDDMDEFNRLFSATTKGTVANVDPTLVIREDPAMNSGSLKKGSDNAIFAKGGADYLELSGTSIQTAMNLSDKLLRYMLDVSSVVLADPDKIGSHAQSAAAMKVIYQPMLNQCDKLRVQYGEGLTVPLLQGMLRVAKKIGSSGKGGPVFVTEDGRRVQERPVVLLPDRIESERIEKDGKTEIVTRTVAREPGDSEQVSLKWPPYFRPSQQDIASRVDTAIKARGIVLSPQTAVKSIAQDFGVTDIQQELVDIEAERMAMTGAAFGPDPSLDVKEPGATEEAPDVGETEMQVELAPTDLAAVVTVNEARAMLQLPPMPLPDGGLSVAAYKAKTTSAGATEGEVEGKAAGQEKHGSSRPVGEPAEEEAPEEGPSSDPSPTGRLGGKASPSEEEEPGDEDDD